MSLRDNPLGELSTVARDIRKSNPRVSVEESMTKAREARPDLYEDFRANKPDTMSNCL